MISLTGQSTRLVTISDGKQASASESYLYFSLVDETLPFAV